MAKDAHGLDLTVGDLVHVPYTVTDIRETPTHALVTLAATPGTTGPVTAPSGVVLLSTHVIKNLPPVSREPIVVPVADPRVPYSLVPVPQTSHPAGLGPLPAQAPPDPHWNRAIDLEQE
jgi:hypothetical protein